MRRNIVKEKLSQGQVSIGTWITLGHIHSTRVLAKAGFDWLTLDVEHSAYDMRETAALVAAIADSGCVPLIRPPDGSHAWIKRSLDAGAYGIVIPMVDTVEQARAAIAAAKYPPVGNRSAGGGMHNLNFDCSAEEYYQRANDSTLVILQTESPQGIANAREIYSLPGVDAIFIGPHDLRFQMRAPDGTFPVTAKVESQIEDALRIGREVGTPIGIHTMNANIAEQRIEQGMSFVGVGSDLAFLCEHTRSVTDALNLEFPKDLARY